MPKENLPASVEMGGVETQVFRLSRVEGDASRNSLKDFVLVTYSCNLLKKMCLAAQKILAEIVRLLYLICKYI